ncbi:MAG: hypothetical protein IJU29_06595, partial [Oscillospiraceae bacterium]|nr:hypothetical protein [Oscillospiraceae bacterium]
ACGWRANFVSAKAQKPQEYFVYFKVFGTQAGAKFAARRARGFIQRFPKTGGHIPHSGLTNRYRAKKGKKDIPFAISPT